MYKVILFILLALLGSCASKKTTTIPTPPAIHTRIVERDTIYRDSTITNWIPVNCDSVKPDSSGKRIAKVPCDEKHYYNIYQERIVDSFESTEKLNAMYASNLELSNKNAVLEHDNNLLNSRLYWCYGVIVFLALLICFFLYMKIKRKTLPI